MLKLSTSFPVEHFPCRKLSSVSKFLPQLCQKKERFSFKKNQFSEISKKKKYFEQNLLTYLPNMKMLSFTDVTSLIVPRKILGKKIN